uniref:Uncharacterized protein n=1 Tax=Rhizophora mucronata TaxID=61149 RepID=A0A2P2LIR2_RHIMU
MISHIYSILPQLQFQMSIQVECKYTSSYAPPVMLLFYSITEQWAWGRCPNSMMINL